jgi:hypothetical protein
MLDKVTQSNSPDVLAELAALRAEVAELRAFVLEQQLADHPSFARDEMSVSAAARLAGRSDQTILNWIASARIGRFDPQLHHYRVSRRRLREYMIFRFGVAPAGLMER